MSNIFPPEIKRAVGCLSDNTRQEIISALARNELTYTEIKESLKLTNGNLNHHLNELIKAGLISRYLGTEEAGEYEKYYKITEFGKDFIKGIFESLIPKSKQPEITSSDFGSTGGRTYVVYIGDNVAINDTITTWANTAASYTATVGESFSNKSTTVSPIIGVAISGLTGHKIKTSRSNMWISR